jgi:PAS domain S-box-containing protein
MARMQAVTAALSESLTSAEVAEVIVAQGVAALGASAGSVTLVSEDGKHLEMLRHIGYPAERVSAWRRFSLNLPTPLSDAVRSQTPIFLESIPEWARRYPNLARKDRIAMAERDQESWAAIPLLAEGHVIGGLGLTFTHRRSFSDDDRAFIVTLARQCAQALERARLYEEARTNERRMRFLASASEALAASLDYQTTLTSLAHLAVPDLADWCAVDMLADPQTNKPLRLERLAVAHVDPEKIQWATELQRRFPPDPNAPRGVFAVLRSGEPEFNPEIPDDMLTASARTPEHLAILREIGFHSVTIVPLRARGLTLGAITFVTTSESGRRFSQSDLAFHQEIARRAATAVDNALLYQEVETERGRATTILESIQDGFYALDREWRFTYVNERCLNYYGRRREELLGQVIWDVFPVAVGSQVYTEYHRAVQEGVPIHFEVLSPLTHLWMEVNAYPSTEGLSVYFRDISSRKRSEEEVRYVTTHARCLLWQGTVEDPMDQTGFFHWETHVLDEAAAQSFCPLELQAGELYTQAWYRYRLPEDQKQTDAISHRAFQENQPEYHSEFRCRDAEGIVRWFSERVHIAPLPSVFHKGLEYRRWRAVGVALDITERRRAEEERIAFLRERESAAQQQRAFLKEVLYSATEGCLRLCDTESDLPQRLSQIGEPTRLTDATIRVLRHRTAGVARFCGFPQERWHDLETAIGEAAMNAVRHGKGGTGSIYASESGDRIQVWIEDQGQGIAMSHLPRATLERGYTTANTFGHGFWMILKTADRVWLLTGPNGTTVVLEQDRMSSMPKWLLWGGNPGKDI